MQISVNHSQALLDLVRAGHISVDAVEWVDKLPVSLIVETRELFLKGGETDAGAVVGKSAESYVVELVAGAGDQVRSIAAAAEQQSATTEAINTSVGDINSLAAKAADTLDHCADAVRELADLANNLNELIRDLQQQDAASFALPEAKKG